MEQQCRVTVTKWRERAKHIYILCICNVMTCEIPFLQILTKNYACSFLPCTTKDLLNINTCPKSWNSMLQVLTLSCINQDPKTLYFWLLLLNHERNDQIYFHQSFVVWKSSGIKITKNSYHATRAMTIKSADRWPQDWRHQGSCSVSVQAIYFFILL